MPEIDPVILQLRADVDKYLTTLRSTTKKVDDLLGTQEKRARQLESQMKRSSGQIAGHLRSLAGMIGTYFTGRELAGLIDEFTRVQNQLRVAGLEGENLASVQQKLLNIGSKYGVSLESLAELFGKTSFTAKELGATQGNLVQLTTATAQALKITGTSTVQASGAILGLSQALASGTVRAEEFNQINEGGLRPLLQAAAASQRWGGSVAKLRADILDGKVSSQEFFQAIMAGSQQLEGTAARATMTLSGGVTALGNALMVYAGEADRSAGASAILGEALKKVADNLDILIPAIATIGAYMGARFVVGVVAGSNALRVLTAYASIATTSLAGTALAAQAAGASIMRAFGGPIGIAMLTFGAAVYYVLQANKLNTEATGAYAKAQDEAKRANEKAADAADKLATAHGKARQEALALARAEAENIKQKLASAKASVILAQAELARIKVSAQKEFDAGVTATRFGGDAGALGGSNLMRNSSQKVTTAQANLNAANATVASLQGSLDRVTAIIDSASRPAVSGVKKEKPDKKASGPSIEDIARRYSDERANLMQQYNSAMGSMALSAEKQAEYEERNSKLAELRTIASIKADKDYTAAQKQTLIAQTKELGEVDLERINFEKKRRLEQEAQQIADEQFRASQDALGIQFDMADTQAERKRLALEMLDLENRHQKSLLEAVIASETATDADKKRAQIALDTLKATESAKASSVARQNETNAERYVRGLNKTSGQINEAIDDIKIDGLNALNDGLTEAIMGAKSLGDVFKNVANQIIADLIRIAVQQAIVRPLAESLFGGGGGGGGGFSLGSAISSISGLFGRAGGGYVQGGQMYRVNEAASAGRVEAFVPQGSGTIIPLGQMNAAVGGGGTVVQHFHLDARGAVMTQDIVNQINSMGQRAAEAGARGGHALAARDMAQMRRPKL